MTATIAKTHGRHEASKRTTSFMASGYQHREGTSHGHSINQDNNHTPTSPIRGNHGSAATGHGTSPIRGKHSATYMPTSPVRGERGGTGRGRDTGPIRGKHSEKIRSPRKRGAADQSIGLRKACKITQGTAFEHVERKPNKPSISWDQPISVELTSCHVGVWNSIDRVGSILRTKHPRVDAVAQPDMGSDNRDSRDKSNRRAEHEPN